MELKMARSSLHSSLMGFTSDCEGKFCFDYYLQPILGFAGFALADPDPDIEQNSNWTGFTG
jgi:hypothetical protein